MFGYIYKITNNINGKIYIGKREKSTFDDNYWGSGKHIKYAINKYGKENFSREVLEWCDCKTSLCKKETYYIELYNATDINIGYNIAKNGYGGGFPHTEEWKLKHSGPGNGRYHKEVSKETRDKISAANRGKARSAEFRMQVSKALTGRKKPDGFSEKVSKAQKGRIKSDLELQHLRDSRVQAANKTKGRHIYNNGFIEKRFYDYDEILNEFKKGRLQRVKDSRKKNYTKNYRWFNNGKIEIFSDIKPDDFEYGRLKKRENKKDN